MSIYIYTFLFEKFIGELEKNKAALLSQRNSGREEQSKSWLCKLHIYVLFVNFSLEKLSWFIILKI